MNPYFKAGFVSAAIAAGNVKNLTPHAVWVAGRMYPASGIVARIESSYEEIVHGVTMMTLGDLKYYLGKDEVALETFAKDCDVLIVSGMVHGAVGGYHSPCFVSPATGHPDVERNDKGHIVSVPAFLV